MLKARLEAEKRTKIFDDKAFAYDVVVSMVDTIKGKLPSKLVGVATALENEDDEDEITSLKEELKMHRKNLDADNLALFREWKVNKGKLPGLEKARVEAFEIKKAADKLFARQGGA